jgi:hypothetical protein
MSSATKDKRPKVTRKKDKRPVVWSPTPKQQEFLSAPEREVLFGGALGGSKTDACLVCAISQIDSPQHRAIFFRRSFPQLRDAIDRSHYLYKPCGGTFHVQSSTWIFPSGSRVEFAFADSDSDRWRYAGRSFNTIIFDELCENPTDVLYVYMLSRLRTRADSGLRLMVRSSANPLGPGASWVRARFNIPDDGGPSTCVDEQTGFHRRFIPARLTDNPHLAVADYSRMLQGLTSQQRSALRDGRWDSVSGSIFEELSDAHVVEPFHIPISWQIWRSCDDGYRANAAVLWCAWDKDGTDTIYIVRELHQSGLTAQALARAVKRIDFEIPIDLGFEVIMNDQPLSGPIDPAAFSDNGQGSRGDEMNRLGCDWKPAVKGANSRLSGISAIHERLAVRRDGTTGLKFFKNCTQVVAELRSLTYDPNGGEDIAPNTEFDHLFDSLRYLLTYKKTQFRTPRIHWAR